MDKWDYRFLEMAALTASFSKDPSTKVGAVVVRPDLTVSGVGFNGFPRGMVDNEELYNDRETKYARTIHAEVNAILNSPETQDCTLYCTHPPCTSCALIIIQAGISRVVCNYPTLDLLSRWGESIEKTKGFFEEVEIEFIYG